MSEKLKYNCEFYVEGMHCAACELLIEKKLSKVEGITKVDAKLDQNKVFISSDKNLSHEELSKLVESEGYKIVGEQSEFKRAKLKDISLGFLIAVVIFGGFLLLQKTGIVNLAGSGEVTLPFVFVIGIIASLSTCMAVVGGLFLSLSSNYAKEHQTKTMIAVHLSSAIAFFV